LSVQVEVRRSGGFGGYRLKGTLDTKQLRAEDTTLAENAVRGLPFGRSAPPPPGRPELMRYQLTVVDADGQKRSVEVNEDELPEELRELIEPVLDLEKPG